jgi:hypothetical protein
MKKKKRNILFVVLPYNELHKYKYGSIISNVNVDIQRPSIITFTRHAQSQTTRTQKRTIIMSLGARKRKGINRIANKNYCSLQ